jgi:hypothetical protein
VPQIPRCPSSAKSSGLRDPLELAPEVGRVQRCTDGRGEHESVILLQGTGRQPVRGLPPAVLPQDLDRGLRKRERPARLSRLGVIPLAHRPPYCYRRGRRPDRTRIAVQVDAIPAQFPCFLGTDPDREAQHYIGVKPRLPGRLKERQRLLKGQRPARAPDRALGRYGRTYGQLQIDRPLVPTDVPTNFLVLTNQASELEPRYGIEP